MARELLFHLWNRKHGTLTKKSIHLYSDDDQGFYAEWAGDREEGIVRFPDYDTAVVAIWQWTVDAGGEWRDLADLQKPRATAASTEPRTCTSVQSPETPSL